MSDFILEIYGEEIPSSAQMLIEKSLQDSFNELFKGFDIKFENIFSYSTSRRIVIFIKGLSKETSPKDKELRGPRVDSDQRAVSGFMKSNNIVDIETLDKKEINGKFYFILLKKTDAKKVNVILQIKIPEILRSINWIKSMRWGSNNDRWIRPIKNILCVFDKKVIKFDFAGVTSNFYTFGNYNIDDKKIKFTNFQNYKKELQKNKVKLDRIDRKKFIIEQLKSFCLKNNLKNKFNQQLVDRVSDSVEWPNAFFGSFSKDYFELPDFLIENILSDKQDYFSFRDKKNKLTNKFCFVSNLEKKKENQLVKGNQNVLRARFSDAKFFIQEDKKKKLHERIDDLKNIVFYEKVGTLFDRSQRINSLINHIYQELGIKLDKKLNNLLISNADLTTELVKEFPSLQGKVGGFLATQEGLHVDLCAAISNQYNYELKSLNNNLLNIVLSISQKFDGIVGYFIAKKKVSGSGDPYGIRRSTLSIIKICIESKIEINFLNLFNYLKKLYKSQKIRIDLEFRFLDDYFKKRIMILLIELGFRQDVIKSSIIDDELNPYLIYERVLKLSTFVNSSEGKDFLKAYKRIDALAENLNNEEIKNDMLIEKEELNLNKLLLEINKKIKNKDKDFIFNDTNILNQITFVVNDFFDNVTVNVKNSEIKKNRKILISKFNSSIRNLGNFSLIETK